MTNGQKVIRTLLVIGLIIVVLVGYNRGWFKVNRPADPAATEAPVQQVVDQPVLPGEDPAAQNAGSPVPGYTVGPADYVDEQTLAIQNASGLNVMRVSTEPGAWYWRGDPLHMPGNCPPNLHCTIDGILEDGGLRAITLWKATASVKHISAVYSITLRTTERGIYPDGALVYQDPPCDLLRAENMNGFNEVPTFRVVAGNFSCPGLEAELQSLMATANPNCPANAEAAAVLLTGNKANSKYFETASGGWHYKKGSPAVTFTIKSGTLNYWNGTSSTLTNSGSAQNVTEATYYCGK